MCFDKEYLMWDLKNKCFIRQKIVDDFKKMNIGEVKNENSVVVESSKHYYHILLRWKNKKGVLYPAYQISIKSK